MSEKTTHTGAIHLPLDRVSNRLLRNLLNYAARDAGKPPVELPSDFDAQLKSMGYQ